MTQSHASIRDLTAASWVYDAIREPGAIVLQRQAPSGNLQQGGATTGNGTFKPGTHDRGRLNIRVEVVVNVGMVERTRTAQQQHK